MEAKLEEKGGTRTRQPTNMEEKGEKVLFFAFAPLPARAAKLCEAFHLVFVREPFSPLGVEEGLAGWLAGRAPKEEDRP